MCTVCIKLQFYRSLDFRIEAKVKIDCSITSLTVYTWTIYNVTNRNLSAQRVEGYSIRDPILYIPKLWLSYGNYSVKLEVSCRAMSLSFI